MTPAGGGDCVEVDGTKVFKTPSQMNNYWCTNESDEERYASYCNDTSTETVKIVNSKYKKELKDE